MKNSTKRRSYRRAESLFDRTVPRSDRNPADSRAAQSEVVCRIAKRLTVDRRNEFLPEDVTGLFERLCGIAELFSKHRAEPFLRFLLYASRYGLTPDVRRPQHLRSMSLRPPSNHDREHPAEDQPPSRIHGAHLTDRTALSRAQRIAPQPPTPAHHHPPPGGRPPTPGPAGPHHHGPSTHVAQVLLETLSLVISSRAYAHARRPDFPAPLKQSWWASLRIYA